MIKIYSRPSQVFSIFGKSTFNFVNKQNNGFDLYKLKYENTDHEILIKKLSNEIDILSIATSLEYFDGLKKYELFNPEPNSIIIADRWIFDTLFISPIKIWGVNYIKKLEEEFHKKNIRVILANAYFEPLDYEGGHYTACSYPYEFNFTRFTDYPLFKDCKNTRYNTFYSLWNYIYDILSYEVSPNNHQSIEDGDETFYNWLEEIVEPKLKRDKVFGMLGGKPRYHRLYFINKIIESGILDKSYLTMNKFFLEEYKKIIDSNSYTTDPIFLYKEDIKGYFNHNFYKPDSFYKDIHDPLGEEKRFEYSTENIVNQEYNNSYIEVVVETHIIFDKLFDFWSEKTYHPLFFKKLFIIVGANKFYKEFEKIGGHTFLNELGITNDFLKEDDPIKQIDMILPILKSLSIEDSKKIYENNLEKIKENKNILLNWVYDNTEFLRQYIIEKQ